MPPPTQEPDETLMGKPAFLNHLVILSTMFILFSKQISRDTGEWKGRFMLSQTLPIKPISKTLSTAYFKSNMQGL